MRASSKRGLLKFLKTKLACGGKLEGEWVELQGDKSASMKLNDLFRELEY